MQVVVLHCGSSYIDGITLQHFKCTYVPTNDTYFSHYVDVYTLYMYQCIFNLSTSICVYSCILFCEHMCGKQCIIL